jgi:hypothetical protein
MRTKITSFTVLCLLFTLSFSSKAQEVITTGGDHNSSTSAKITWTIGEPVTETVIGTNSILTQGFNQGDLVLTMIIDPEMKGYSIKVFPNPAHDMIKISLRENEIENLNYMIIDMEGKVVSKNSLKGMESEIPVGNFTPAIYFLKIYQGKTEVATYKIIKK